MVIRALFYFIAVAGALDCFEFVEVEVLYYLGFVCHLQGELAEVGLAFGVGLWFRVFYGAV